MTERSGAGAGLGDVGRILYCIGAHKAGTTWLHHAMRLHPQVHATRIKEVHYWDAAMPPHKTHHARRAEERVARIDRFGPLGRALDAVRPGRAAWAEECRRHRRMYGEMDPTHRSYRDYLLAEWSGEPVVADVSPGYALLGPEAFRAMDAFAPDARFVFVMRDPVSRLWSNTRHSRNRGLLPEGRGADLDAAFRGFLSRPGSAAHRRGAYEATIRALEAAVPADRIAYFFQETLFEPQELGRLAGFLGIAPIAADPAERVNPGFDGGEAPAPELLAAAREAYAPTYSFIADRFGPRLPEAWCGPDRVPA